MELIYLWSKEYKNLKQAGFNFSKNFEIDFNTKSGEESLVLKKKDKKFHIFEETKKVKNVIAIIGKNGSGKTNILNLLGIKRNERIKINNKDNIDYFLIYHYKEDLFVIEGNDFSYIKPFLSSVENIDLVTNTYSIIVKYENNKFNCYKFLQFDEDAHQSNVYFTYRNNYDREMLEGVHSFQIEPEYTVLFNRLYLSNQNTGHLAKYKMLLDFNNFVKVDENLNLKVFKLKSKTDLTIKQDLFIDSNFKLEIIKKFNDTIKIHGIYKEKFNHKEHFINKLSYSICKMLVPWVFQNPDEVQSLNEKIKLKSVNESYIEYCLGIIIMLLDIKESNDEYFSKREKETIIKVFKQYFNIINLIDEDYFLDEKIIVPTYTNFNEKVGELLKLLNDIKYLDGPTQSILSIFSISYGSLSSGEEALISLFSALHHGLTQNLVSRPKNAILLLDEPDNFMHPEWSRMLLNEIIEFLNTITTEYQSFQIILTTHSPFIVSDLPAENVIALEKDYISGNSSIINIGETFANNIHTLLSEEFFISSTLGEYAKNKINEVIELIISPSKLSVDDKGKIEYLISVIGEPLIKDKLRMMMDRRVH